MPLGPRLGDQARKMGAFSNLEAAPDFALDLGTANTIVFVKDQGIVLSEPSVVAVDNRTGKVVAVGSAAKDMIGRTPGDIVAMQPLKSGVIADFEVTQQMLSYFIGQTRSIGGFHRYVSRPHVVVCVPSGVTKVERRAVREATQSGGTSRVHHRGTPGVGNRSGASRQ